MLAAPPQGYTSLKDVINPARFLMGMICGEESGSKMPHLPYAGWQP